MIKLLVLGKSLLNKIRPDTTLELVWPLYWMDDEIWSNVLPFQGIYGMGFKFNLADMIKYCVLYI